MNTQKYKDENRKDTDMKTKKAGQSVSRNIFPSS
ncbi:unnamed protein product, partial [marine sediment metagenome]